MTSSPTLEQAIRALAADDTDHASARNDVGYNGSDSAWGNRLARLAVEGRLRWRPGEYAEARERISKYRRQLATKGIEFDLIPDAEAQRVESWSQVARVPGVCILCGGGIVVGEQFKWGQLKGSREHVACPAGANAPESVAAGRQAAPAPAPVANSADEAEDALEAFLDSPPSQLASAATGILGPGGVIASKLPGYESRPQQLRMAELVEASIAAHRHAVVEAGTGTGKSLGYLVPAILSGKRTVVSTADKALQEQIWRKDVPFLQGIMPTPFTAALLKGRGNYVCRREVARLRGEGEQSSFAEPEFKSMQAAEAWPQFDRWLREQEADAEWSGDLESAPFQVPGELRGEVTVDRDGCTGKKCPAYALCYAERAKAKADDAQVVIVNHALLLRDLELRSLTGGHVAILPAPEVVVLDEAHHLEDVATDAFGVEVSERSWGRLAGRMEKLARKAGAGGGQTEGQQVAEEWMARCLPVAEATGALFRALEARMTLGRVAVERLGDESALWAPCKDALLPFLEQWVKLEVERARGTRNADYTGLIPAGLTGDERAQWLKLFKGILRYSTHLIACLLPTPEGETPDVRFAQVEGQNGARRLVLKAKPLDVSGHLRARLFDPLGTREEPDEDADDEDAPDRRQPAVFNPVVISTSATISGSNGFAYWRGRVGMDDGDELEVGSPFDYRRNALLYLPARADVFDPSRARGEQAEAYLDALAEEMERLVEASLGRAFLLFTSNAALDATYRRLYSRLVGRYPLLRQGDAPRPELVRRFKEAGNAVLFGVKSFWEGVDVQGEALSLVVIDKLPFTPPDDPVWAARCDAANARAQERGDKGWEWAWFDELALPSVTIALKQGFGRLIRTKTDRGVVALLDGRLSTKRYGRKVLDALPPASRANVPANVAAFFGAGR